MRKCVRDREDGEFTRTLALEGDTSSEIHLSDIKNREIECFFLLLQDATPHWYSKLSIELDVTCWFPEFRDKSSPKRLGKRTYEAPSPQKKKNLHLPENVCLGVSQSKENANQLMFERCKWNIFPACFFEDTNSILSEGTEQMVLIFCLYRTSHVRFVLAVYSLQAFIIVLRYLYSSGNWGIDRAKASALSGNVRSTFFWSFPEAKSARKI